jgi:hypothetical protein
MRNEMENSNRNLDWKKLRVDLGLNGKIILKTIICNNVA